MRTLYYLPLLLLFLLPSCSTDENELTDILVENNEQGEEMSSEDPNPEDEENSNTAGNDCHPIGFVFEESNGIISIEFENNDFPEGWKLKNDVAGVSGDGYMQWEGSPSLGTPGNGGVSFPLKITNIGTYRFTWHSSFRKGSNGTEHNDTWLRFPDAADFFGKKGSGSVVYPSDSGKSPNPNGASKEGWFKIYRSGNNNSFSWQALTSDNDGHEIYVVFETPGVYELEVSARSDFHGIDRMLLYKEDMNQNDAIMAADTFSTKISCD